MPSLILSQEQKENRADVDNNEENDSSIDGDDGNVFIFVISTHVDTPALDNRISEEQIRSLDAAATRSEHDREVANWIEHNVLWSKIHDERELNLMTNEIKKYAYGNLWRLSMKTLKDHLMEENREHRKCTNLPDMRSTSPCQFGALTSDFFLNE